jgi:hypothetical protein
MSTPQASVLVTHRLFLYAETLATVLAEWRPCLTVRQLTPDELADALAAHPEPLVIVTDEVTPAVDQHAGGWLLYLPDDQNVMVSKSDGPPDRIERPVFADVVAAIDRLVSYAVPGWNPAC